MTREADDHPMSAENRKAFFDYHILETFEAGIALLGTEVTANTAQGGAGGSGGGQQPDGKPGDGSGGGLSIDASAAVFLDAYTVDHIRRNKVSTADRDVYGSYVLNP